MTIEVRQLTIKSSVLPEGNTGSNSRRKIDDDDIDEMLAYILAECRQMIADMLRMERER